MRSPGRCACWPDARRGKTLGGPHGVAWSIRMRFASSVDDTPIAFEEQGQGSPAVVFVHGWACDRTYWRHQVDRFQRRAKVVTLDLAGHGESGADRSEWSIAGFGADVAAVVQALELRDVVLVGHSMGGDVIA